MGLDATEEADFRFEALCSAASSFCNEFFEDKLRLLTG
jgi:hypothetical protein